MSDIPLSESIAINIDKDLLLSKSEITNSSVKQEYDSSVKKEYDLNSIFDFGFDKCNLYIQKVKDYKTSELKQREEIIDKFREDNNALCNEDLALGNYAKKVQYLTFRDLLQLNAKGLTTGKQNVIYCQNCETNAIKGLRYRCSVCSDFNVCEKCISYISLYHNKEHPFILKNTEPVSKKETPPNTDTTINALLEPAEEIQSEFAYKKTTDAIIKVKVTNNGTTTFKVNTVLYMTTGNDGMVPVKQLKPNESEVYEVKVGELDKLEIGHYIKEILIKDDYGNFGNTLKITVIIKE